MNAKLIDDLNMRTVEFCLPELLYFPSRKLDHLIAEESASKAGHSNPRLLVELFYQNSPYFVRNVNHRKNMVLPDDLMRFIQSFIGEEVLHYARRKCTMDRYFPNGRDDVVKMLKQWRNIDLIKFSEHVYLRYNVNYDRKRWRRISLRKSCNKTSLIENLLSCNYRCTFFDFLRDVYFLTRILNSKRGYRKGRTNIT